MKRYIFTESGPPRRINIGEHYLEEPFKEVSYWQSLLRPTSEGEYQPLTLRIEEIPEETPWTKVDFPPEAHDERLT